MRRETLKNSRRLVGRRTYSAGELVKELGIHRQTLRDWRESGLVPIDISTHPWLYFGRAVKTFISNRHDARKTKLGAGEFYCLRCRQARKAKLESLQSMPTGKVTRTGKVSLMLSGVCDICGCKVRRASVEEAEKSSTERQSVDGDK